MTLVEAARTYIGVPFRHQGRTRLGLDCAGLILVAARDCDRYYTDMRAYGRRPWMNGLCKAVEGNLGPPVTGEPQIGDVALMRFATEPQHVAILGDYLHGGLSLIHTDATLGKVTEHRLDDGWSARIVAIYRPAP